MALYPSIYYEIKIVGGDWEDITPDVVTDRVTCNYGIRGNKINDRLATTGTIKFTLRNDSGCIGGVNGYYSPGHANCKVGFNKGIGFRVKIVYDIFTKYKFIGHITTIRPDIGVYGDKRVVCVCEDWLGYATNQPIDLEIAYNKTCDEGINLILAQMQVQPESTNLAKGYQNFSTLFDNATANVKPYSLLNSLAQSEIGYIYLTFGDKETLNCENRHSRSGASLTEIYASEQGGGRALCQEVDDYCRFLITEEGEYLLADWIDFEVVDLTDYALDISNDFGTNLINSLSSKVYPRRTSDSNEVLFKTDVIIPLGAGETRVIRGNFIDFASGALKVAGRDMVELEAGTDYRMYSQSSQSGVNLTSYLTVTVTYYSTGAEFTISNVGSKLGYVYLQCRGKAVYTYNTVTNTIEDTTSINNYGYTPLTIEARYEDQVDALKGYSSFILANEKTPKIVVNKVFMNANKSYKDLLRFLFLDIGDSVYLTESQAGINGYYYIQGVDFVISQNIIAYTYILKEHIERNNNFWILNVSSLGVDTILGY